MVGRAVGTVGSVGWVGEGLLGAAVGAGCPGAGDAGGAGVPSCRLTMIGSWSEERNGDGVNRAASAGFLKLMS